MCGSVLTKSSRCSAGALRHARVFALLVLDGVLLIHFLAARARPAAAAAPFHELRNPSSPALAPTHSVTSKKEQKKLSRKLMSLYVTPLEFVHHFCTLRPVANGGRGFRRRCLGLVIFAESGPRAARGRQGRSTDGRAT